jgi:heptosyltransferase-2
LPYSREAYIVDKPEPFNAGAIPGAPVVGLNTGCGSRWPIRQWPYDNWEKIIGLLQNRGFGVVLLGGPDEDERNRKLSAGAGARYFGTVPLGAFAGLVDMCDIVVTGVTMALHLAIGLEKQVVLLNNIFNRYEFELYGRGEIIEPPHRCRCYYKNACADPCMHTITPERVAEAVENRAREIAPRAL